MPSTEELHQIYENLYSADKIRTGATEQESGDYASVQYGRYILENFVNADYSVLDFGTGSGFLVEYLRHSGINADGFEMSEAAVAFASTSKGLDLLNSFDDKKENTYNFVSMIEVIEHLPEPAEQFSELKRVMKCGSTLFLTTPNRRSLRACMEGGTWREAVKGFHLSLFDFGSLKVFLENQGFVNVQRITFSPLSRPGWRSALLGRVLQTADLNGTLCISATLLK
jgi:2-polyprenyl-3-methyl-5-hydroxy-6-metoxy-1,4-benzoquinol methylase